MRNWPIFISTLLFFITPLLSEDKKEEKKEEPKPQPPKVLLTLPFAIINSPATRPIKIRGQHLAGATTVGFPATSPAVKANIKSAAKSDPPKPLDAAKAGDSQVELELIIAAGVPAGPLSLTVTTPAGQSAPHALLVLDSAATIEEKEPNPGFSSAQPIEFGKTIFGLILENNDVDTFTFHGKTGQRITAKVVASTANSSLDSILTLHDAAGHPLATSDDHDGRPDSHLTFTIPIDGVYHLTLIDAHDKGSLVHHYLLTLTAP